MAKETFDPKILQNMLGDMDSRLKSIEQNTNIAATATKSSGEERLESARAEKIKANNDKKQTVLLEQMVDGVKGLGESMKKLADSMKQKTKAGVGMLIAGLMAPIITIVAFFKQLSAEFTFLKKLTGGGLKKIFKPLKTFFSSEAGIGKFFGDLGKKMNPKNWKWVQTLQAFFTELKTFQKFDKMWKGLKGGFTKFGTIIGKVFKPILGMFESIFSLGKTLVSSGKIATKIVTWAGKFGSFLGKIFLPITILMSAFDFITGFMKGYEEEGILGGLEGGLTKLFQGLIGMPLDLLKDGVSWVLEKFGWEQASTWLDSFSFSKLIEDTISGYFDMVKKVVDWFGKLFTDPISTLQTLWNDTLEGAVSIGKWIGDNVLAPITKFFVDTFTWSDDTLDKFSVMDKAEEMWGKIKEWFSDIFTFEWPKIEMPSIGEMLKGFAPAKDSLAWKLLPSTLYDMIYGGKPKPPPTPEEQERKEIEKEAQANAGKGGVGELISAPRSRKVRLEENERHISNLEAQLARNEKGRQTATSVKEKARILDELKGKRQINAQFKAEPVKSGGGSAIRKINPKNIGIDWDFISKKEGGSKLNGYVPDPDGSKSGVTIATGFDLGARRAKDLEGLPQDLQAKLSPYLGLQGQSAVAALQQIPLKITPKEAKHIDKMSKGTAVNKLQREWNKRAEETGGKKFEDLSSAQQTVAASVAFQYGSLSKTPNFRKAMQTGDWSKAIDELNNFGDSYVTRRKSEAKYLMASLDPNKKTQAFNELQTANAEGKMGGMSGTTVVAPTVNKVTNSSSQGLIMPARAQDTRWERSV